ncbi:MAG: proline dehydrogenase family protein [Blastocatellia bacterium]|nr:proline dehydrogenase family protein [Blastocatellia bacterium]
MITKDALLYLSKQESLKNVLTNISLFKKITDRFVAGETIEEAALAVKELNKLNISVTFDHLGEAIKSEAEAEAEVVEYGKILSKIDKDGLNSNVSLKPTQLGLAIDPELGLRNIKRVVEKARAYNNFVRIDMEDTPYTTATIDMFKKLRQEYDNVGIVIQAYLYRSKEDIQDLLKCNARIRLCKGAYDEPATVAFPKKIDTDKNYVELMKILLESGIYHGIATHDPKMIKATRDFSKEKNIPKSAYEFQMLYGVRRDLQLKLAGGGYNIRVYVPYGKHWYPYFMRRLAERPANIWFIMKNFFLG